MEPRNAVRGDTRKGGLQMREASNNPGAEAAAAGLVSGERRLVQHADPGSASGERQGGRGAGGAGPDDEHVGRIGLAGRRKKVDHGGCLSRWLYCVPPGAMALCNALLGTVLSISHLVSLTRISRWLP